MNWIDKLDRVCKWRTLFAGWQLGTRSDTDPEAQAVKDQRELLIILRCELTALTGLLIKKGVIDQDDFQEAVGDEADLLNADYERRFPGVRAELDGLHFSDPAKMMTWMKGWKP